MSTMLQTMWNYRYTQALQAMPDIMAEHGYAGNDYQAFRWLAPTNIGAPLARATNRRVGMLRALLHCDDSANTLFDAWVVTAGEREVVL